jgi:hypothetical protein
MHNVVYDGDVIGNNQYNHCPSVEYFQGKFYAVWNTNDVQYESGYGQTVVCSTSNNFVNWSTPIHFVGSEGNAINPIENTNGLFKQWQPNLLNYNDQELWCFWYNQDFEDSGMVGLYLSSLAMGATQWSNREIIHRATCEGYACTPFSGQNPVLLSSGRVLVPVTFTASGDTLSWNRHPRFNAIAFSDDGGQNWGISNLVTSPENISTQWEFHVFEQYDSKIRAFYVNRTYSGFPVPIPTKRMLTCTGTGVGLGAPVLLEPDAHYSHVETVRNRMQTIQLSSGRYCMFLCDVYDELSAYESRQNIALWFSRTGKDDFVAGPGIQPRNEVGSYPQGIEHDGKIYVVYTRGANGTNRAIQGACIDPAPNASSFYIWPRSKDLLEMEYVDGIAVRTNPDYEYVQPYLTTLDGRNAITFEKRGTAGVEIDPVDFAAKECIKFSFDTKIGHIQDYFNLILCTFGDKLPIRIGVPGNRQGKLYADNGRGWQECGTLPLGEWETIEIVFAGDYFTVKVGNQGKRNFMNPVKNPNPRLYLGEGYESDIYNAGQAAIRNNDDSTFYIDVESIYSVVEEIDTSGNVSEEYNTYGSSHRPIIDSAETFYTIPSLGTEAIYFPFEGAAATDPAVPNTEAWSNKGNYGIGEYPGTIGTAGIGGYPKITTTNALKGQAYDGSDFQANSPSKSYAWGYLTKDIGTDVESSLSNIWSFSLTCWIYNGPSSLNDIDNARLLATPPIQIVNYGTGLKIAFGRIGTYITIPEIDAGEEWIFLGITYDGTVAHDAYGNALEDNVKIYKGTTSIPAQLIATLKAQTNEGGRLVRDIDGAMLTIGNQTYNGSRPWTGMIDEIRLWTNGPESGTIAEDAIFPLAVLSHEEIERTRINGLELDNNSGNFYPIGDLNLDGVVNLLDFNLFSQDWLGILTK